MLGNIVVPFEWQLVRKGTYKCSRFTIMYAFPERPDGEGGRAVSGAQLHTRRPDPPRQQMLQRLQRWVPVPTALTPVKGILPR